MIENHEAINSLVPKAKCATSGGKITLWEDTRPQPSDKEIAAKKVELETQALVNNPLKQQILDIERTITLRRLLEGGQWVEDRKAEIANLRSQLI